MFFYWKFLKLLLLCLKVKNLMRSANLYHQLYQIWEKFNKKFDRPTCQRKCDTSSIVSDTSPTVLSRKIDVFINTKQTELENHTCHTWEGKGSIIFSESISLSFENKTFGENLHRKWGISWFLELTDMGSIIIGTAKESFCQIWRKSVKLFEGKKFVFWKFTHSLVSIFQLCA